MNPQRNPVGWFEIYVQDMARAKVFYEKMLAVTLAKLESPDLEMWAFPFDMNAPGAAGALVKMGERTPAAAARSSISRAPIAPWKRAARRSMAARS